MNKKDYVSEEKTYRQKTAQIKILPVEHFRQRIGKSDRHKLILQEKGEKNNQNV